MVTSRVALGFKPHTGWAAVVAVAGRPDDLKILARRRIELLPPDGSIPKHLYHAAEEMGMPQAADFLGRAGKACEKAALRAIHELLKSLEAERVRVAGVAIGSGKIPDELASILKAHTLVHAAEGVFFCRMLATACAGLGLKVVTARERAIWDDAASRYDLTPAVLRGRIDGVRKRIGAPWSADQKVATAAALCALRN
jgi:hypothetical protein